MLVADQFTSSSLPVTGMRREMKLIRTSGIQMKLRCDHYNCNRNLSNGKYWPNIFSKSSTGFEPLASAFAR